MGTDIPRTMDEIDALQLRRNPEWRTTLEYYEQLQLQQRQADPNGDGWVARPVAIPGVEAAELSAIHGRLIAYGLLKFDVGGRDAGVKYQLSPQGRRALAGEGAATESDELELADSASA